MSSSGSSRGSSLAKRALAIIILAVAAWILLKIVIGIIASVAWIVVAILAVFAIIWALKTL